MNRHTPGPWAVTADGINIKTKDTDIMICENGGETGATEDKANARLIAAAPDMLEALENLENNGVEIPDHAWIMIKNAIDKATGKS
jgi:hypothetical protein